MARRKEFDGASRGGARCVRRAESLERLSGAPERKNRLRKRVGILIDRDDNLARDPSGTFALVSTWRAATIS